MVKIVVAYDPLFLGLIEARGGFLGYAKISTRERTDILEKYRGFVGADKNGLGESGVIFLPHDAVTDFAHSNVTTHEVKHMLQEIERRGLYIPKVLAPVHGSYKNLSPNKKTSLAYRQGFSFEELVNFAENICGLARQSKEIASADEGTTKRIELANDIRTLIQLSQEIRDAIVQVRPWVSVDLYRTSFDFGVQHKFELVPNVPEAILKGIRESQLGESEKIEELKKYLYKQIKKIGELANFNIE